ncbi:hypothetical protein BAUCODRAFT_77438 [Baudoinia panamericana UAMH 10762]|uniref:FAD-binding FR-type domain-containing protein n=1 Tax=Baudoinia panamericana (strain UAMH 10762) TaxID=717646 RepID=M2N1W7_BAUPA|nr:uncharacterized protein BAUCODRAFT_77438 [Baudoinia panamericana UAMH 10762]EMC92964.1 hypothetical protein BAUCODRAFT_77438 [Baudoinia panamericana UAMH 10762]
MLARRVRAMGMYQPPTIPFINVGPPSNATTYLVLLLLGLNIFYLLFNIRYEFELVFVFADRASLLFVANLPWLYILAAKNQPIKLLTGYSYENTNILHRRLGEWMCLLALLHGAGILVAWYLFFGPNGMSLWDFLTRRIIILGIAAFVCYELLFVTSLASFRRWWYEVFLGAHILLQAAGLALVYFHHRGGRVYTLVALAIFLVDRLVFRLAMKTRFFRADLTVMEDGKTVLVSTDWPKKARWSSIRSALTGIDVKHGWQPSEHVFLSVPALARKHLVQAHPFTIASAAPEGDQQHAWFSLIIRAHDGFSSDLLRYARSHASADIRLDGPYGSMHALEMLRSSDIALLVVGGSGIAVAYPILWTLLHENDAETVRSRRKVGLIWTVHEASHLEWIGHERLDELRKKGLQVCIPAPTSNAGRPDIGTLAQKMLEDMSAKQDADGGRVGVVVSGPDGMNSDVRNRCARLAWQGWDIQVAVEKYGW